MTGAGQGSPWGEPARLPTPPPESVRTRPAGAPLQAGGPLVWPGLLADPPRRVARPALRVTRASAALIIIALAVALALAAGIGFVIYLLAGVIHHAANT